MKSSVHLRNAAIALLTIVLLYLASSVRFPSPVTAQTLAELTVLNSPQTGDPGGTATFNFRLTNNDTIVRTFTIAPVLLPSTPQGYSFTFSSPIVVQPGTSSDFNLTVNIPTSQAQGALLTGQATVTSAATGSSPQIQASTQFRLQISGPTSTSTPAPATLTPTRGPVCSDGFEPDNDLASARPIDVNTTQERAICPVGDEDWLVFGGVGGKVYTIDITRMDSGLDLTLEIYDDQGRSIAFNDDFFDRPPPQGPNPGDVRPRIQSLTIPYDGRYYIKVRDAAGRGGVDFIYVIALIAESYGPTPTTVIEICLDLFEPDGLPEQARLITSNEIQEIRRLCPTGDADWVTFFAKTGKRYIIFTDTRRYRGSNTVNGETQAGADTVMALTDRDGVSLIDFNDDIPGGNTLDSQIEFIPQVDGFYFVQIKNVGDIGNQFIRYDLSLLLCLPGQTDCGRASQSGTAVPANPVTPNPQNPSPTPADEFIIPETRTATP